jgi:phosphohistidine phosphatase SixA
MEKCLNFRNLVASGLAGIALASCASAGEAGGLDAAVAQLRAGGNIIVMRHATSPAGQKAAVGLTAGCDLAPGRGLSAQGFAEARAIGEWLAENGVRIDKTYTSDMCRSYDTARLVAAAGNGPVIPRAEMKSDDPATAEAFKAMLAVELSESPKANILLVNHSNIAPLYWSGPLEDEEETPSGRVHVVKDGATVRIDVNVKLSAAPALKPSLKDE